MYSEEEDCCIYSVFVYIPNVIEKSDEGEKKYIHTRKFSHNPAPCAIASQSRYFTYIVWTRSVNCENIIKCRGSANRDIFLRVTRLYPFDIDVADCNVVPRINGSW